jgi:hypothetical protein
VIFGALFCALWSRLTVDGMQMFGSKHLNPTSSKLPTTQFTGQENAQNNSQNHNFWRESGINFA